MKVTMLLVVTCGLSLTLNFFLLSQKEPVQISEREKVVSKSLRNDLASCLSSTDKLRKELFQTKELLQQPQPQYQQPFKEAVKQQEQRPPPQPQQQQQTFKKPSIFSFIPYKEQDQFTSVADSWAWAFHPRVHFICSSNTSAEVSTNVLRHSGHDWKNVVVPGREGGARKTLCGKTLRYLHWACSQSDFRSAEWVLKADTDTLVMWNSLERELSKYNPEESYYLGYVWNMVPFQLERAYSWQDGGAGYAISKGAMNKLCSTTSINEENGDVMLGGFTPAMADKLKYEDVLVGHLLSTVGVKPNYDMAQKFSHFLPSEWRQKGVASSGAVTFHGIKDTSCIKELGALLEYIEGPSNHPQQMREL